MRRRTGFGLLVLTTALIVSCPPEAPPVTSAPDAGPTGWQMPQRPDCAGGYAELPTPTAPLGDPLLVEVSGLVASPSQPSVLWMHNDSGDAARLYAADTEGRALLRVELVGVDFTDAEDIAAAPCPDASGPCLWVADVGNNRRDRDQVFVFAVPEPEVDVEAEAMRTIQVSGDDVWRFPLRYPGLPFDAEALVVLPDASALVLIEKRDAAESRVVAASAPFARDEDNFLEVLGMFANPGVGIENGRMITGADLHPNGERMLVRTYTGVFEVFLGEAGALGLPGEVAETITLGPLSEPQGEAIAYDDSGKGVWTVSEDPNQQQPKPLNHYACFE